MSSIAACHAGLCVTDSTSAPTRLVFGPVLVHRRHTLSAFAIPCVEPELPGHHGDAPGGMSVDAWTRCRLSPHWVEG